MIYLQTGGHHSITPDKFGVMTTPNNGNIYHISNGILWAMDNGQFSNKTSIAKFVSKMNAMKKYKDTCLFVTAIDVIGNAAETIKLYPEWREIIRSFGYPAAFVGQDGLEDYRLPDDFDAFFIGGSTRWKLSKQARELAQEAKKLGKWLHMGRVNSLARIHYAESIGCDSVDGTHAVFAPDRNARELIAWMNQKSLFLGGYE